MEQATYDVAEFCAAHRISRSRLYKEWKEGIGPRVIRAGSKILISREAAADWRRARETTQAPTADTTEAA